MLDASNDSEKIVVTCRFIQHDQWLTTHIEPSWTIRQLKLWFIYRLFGISIPPRMFAPTPKSGKPAERPPSPITFAPDPRTRPASPIIFAAPQKRWLSDTDEDLLSGSEDSSSGFSSVGRRKGKGKAGAGGDGVHIEEEGMIPGGRIGPSHTHSDSESIPGHNPMRTPSYTTPDGDRFPGGVNPHHWSITRYSTGQLLMDDESLVSWYDINEFELLELHGLSFPSTHALYEYQVCHLWNQERHRERERLRKKLKKRFEAEAREWNKDSKDNVERLFSQAQVLKAMNLNSGAGANVGVVEYYGAKIASRSVDMTLTRIPRSIDKYVQPYWEGWVRTLRIVWRADCDEFASGLSASQVVDPYRYGVYGPGTVTGGFGMGIDYAHGQGPGGDINAREKSHQMRYPNRFTRVEWRERWVKIQNGFLCVLKDREDQDATHVLPLAHILALTNTQHLARYLPYTGFNPPLDHPAVSPDILIPAVNLPIVRPPPPSSDSYSDPDSDDPLHPRPRKSHHSHGLSLGGPREFNFGFPNNTRMQQHVKARELTPLVGSRFDPSYLPITTEEQRASGLRVVCLQFRKFHSSTSNMATAALHARSQNDPDHTTLGERQKQEKEEEEAEEWERQTAIDPITLALEDIKERAGEWGGIRTNCPLWRCPRNLRCEPAYITRARIRMRMRSVRGTSRGHGIAGGGRSMSGKSFTTGGRNSTIRGLAELGYDDSNPNARRTVRAGAGVPSSGHPRKDRIYNQDRDQRMLPKSRPQDKELDIHGLLAAQIFGGGIPSTAKTYKEAVEEKERKERKERRKREKELEKERAKQEKEMREREKRGRGKEKEKEDRDKDWGLGTLNVDFWNWGKKKKAKKEMERERRMRLQREQEIEAHFEAATAAATSTTSVSTLTAVSASASTSTVQLSSAGHGQGTGTAYGFEPYGPAGSASTNTITTTTTTTTESGNGVVHSGSSVTAIGEESRRTRGGSTKSVGASSEDDEDEDARAEFASWGHGRSESSAIDSSDDDEDEDESDDDDDTDDDQDVVEPYPDAQPDNLLAEDEDDDDEIEYADLPSQNPDRLTQQNTNTQTFGEPAIPSVIVQVEVAKRVESETETDHRSRSGTVVFTGHTVVPSKEPIPPVPRLPSAAELNQNRGGMLQGQGKTQGEQTVTKKPSQKLIGQLHSSDDEHPEEDQEHEDEDAELSSPVFAPPPSRRRRFKSFEPSSGSGHGHTESTRSGSSQGSFASVEDEYVEEEEEDFDLNDDIFGHRRVGYRYGSYETKRGEEKRRRAEYEKEIGEQREREAKIREQRELEAKQKQRDKEEKERLKEREKRERKKKEDEGEWVCLDIGNDFAFQSFLRIVHQHCPHPMKSSFMERMMGGPLNDTPPPPQTLPQPLTSNPYSESTSNSMGPSSPSAHSHQSHSQSQPRHETSASIGSVVESTRPSAPNSPTSLHSQHNTSTPSSSKSASQHASVPSSPSNPSSYSSHHAPPSPSPSPSEEEINSETEYVAPLPGYGDPRFTYPSRTFATPPYPEWRLNVLRKAQLAGMGDVGRAMEMIHWGREDPVIVGASGATNDLDRMGRRLGTRGGLGGFPGGAKDQGKGKNRESMWSGGVEDNVSSLGTIGPRTVGSGGTIKGAPLGSPTMQRKRMSLEGKSARSTSSSKGILEVPREGGESGNESSREESDGSVGSISSGESGGRSKEGRSPKTMLPSFGMPGKLSNWSDEEEENASEPEWVGWGIDIRRQAKRQYAIQARREANAALGTNTELDLGLPVDPADDMNRYLLNRHKLEPSAQITRITFTSQTPQETTTSGSVSVSHSLSASTQATNQRQWGNTTGSVTGASSPTKIGTDMLSPHHARTPSQQQHHALHHSASLHTGLRKGAQDPTLRRPSMPILTAHAESKDKEEKGKSKERSLWGPFGTTSSFVGYRNDEVKSPTTAGSWFSLKRDGRDREMKDMLSPAGTASQPGSAGGSVGRSGSILLKGGLLRKKDSGDITRYREREREREREKTKMNEGEGKRGQRPQLWVATSATAASSTAESLKSPEHIKSPTFVPKRFGVKKMQSDASILSHRTGGGDPASIPEVPSSPHLQHQKKPGTVEKLLGSSLDSADGK
ncbi:hypothetical protein P691DRAFT_810135 [Macrolepiota fuliginosa MF-IS2]|uniref:Uncharacterized protein n=1 Tax=Macrolepiota fuliginosa MF-IS2 TaxID=1400762 RepID=A0A9P6BYK5_9AGAR|nr:hypothetical protein P691DRAFT_810135 [Macrolepiota fuliginosa MF-IS2]